MNTDEIIQVVDTLFGGNADLSGRTLTDEQLLDNDAQYQQQLDQEQQQWESENE
jgi:hypothetical protein